MTFEQAVEIILRHEGGYVNSEKDPGGETNFGISKRAYPNEDIKNMTRERAIEIYRKDYWNALRLNEFPLVLRLIVFDCGVNCGVHAAIGLLQNALGVKIDGKLGKETFNAFLRFNAETLLSKYAQARLKYYFENRNFQTFGFGWVKRLLDISLRSS